jgi:hypothetical protein
MNTSSQYWDTKRVVKTTLYSVLAIWIALVVIWFVMLVLSGILGALFGTPTPPVTPPPVTLPWMITPTSGFTNYNPVDPRECARNMRYK